MSTAATDAVYGAGAGRERPRTQVLACHVCRHLLDFSRVDAIGRVSYRCDACGTDARTDARTAPVADPRRGQSPRNTAFKDALSKRILSKIGTDGANAQLIAVRVQCNPKTVRSYLAGMRTAGLVRSVLVSGVFRMPTHYRWFKV